MVAPQESSAEEVDVPGPTHEPIVGPDPTIPVPKVPSGGARLMPEPKDPTPEEIALHMRAHLPYRHWCKCCLAGTGPIASIGARETNGLSLGYPVILFVFFVTLAAAS